MAAHREGMMFAKALFATDLSPASDAMIDCIAGLRSLGTHEILLLHAIFVRVHYPEMYDTEDALRKACQAGPAAARSGPWQARPPA